MVDVSDHELVPEHVVLDDADVEEVLEEYGVEKTSLPKIKRKDPALPDDAVVGDVIKVIRDSRTTDDAIVYRLVID